MSERQTALSMANTAAAVGLSAERFRKVWKTWRREQKFPAPFRAPDAQGHGTYAWDPLDVDAWKASRKAEFDAPRQSSNDNPVPDPPVPERRVSRDRAVLRNLMSGRR